mmetsp:Transcript_13013/g.37693  ORF Transcript_13013/g.37693 Transcript_13013/m.37693 type:complete len:214 (+) Transcript_13013:411-1052(+)
MAFSSSVSGLTTPKPLSKLSKSSRMAPAISAVAIASPCSLRAAIRSLMLEYSLSKASNWLSHSALPAASASSASAISCSIFSTSLSNTSSFLCRKAGEFRISFAEESPADDSPASTISSSETSLSASACCSSAHRHVEPWGRKDVNDVLATALGETENAFTALPPTARATVSNNACRDMVIMLATVIGRSVLRMGGGAGGAGLLRIGRRRRRA